MERVTVARWVIRVLVFPTVLVLPASVQTQNRPQEDRRTDCELCSVTTPTVPNVPATLHDQPAGVPGVRREIRPASLDEPARDGMGSVPVPHCLEFGSVMRKPTSGPSLSR
jgi:hypothetical protein